MQDLSSFIVHCEQKSMRVVGIPPEEQQQMFRLLAAILHLGMSLPSRLPPFPHSLALCLLDYSQAISTSRRTTTAPRSRTGTVRRQSKILIFFPLLVIFRGNIARCYLQKYSRACAVAAFAAELLGVKLEMLEKALCNRTVQRQGVGNRGSSYLTPLSPEEVPVFFFSFFFFFSPSCTIMCTCTCLCTCT